MDSSQTSRSKNILLVCISLFIGLTAAELGLRIYGIVPGIHNYDRSFTWVDSLTILKGFYADSEGIFRVDPATVADINKRLSANPLPKEGHLFDPHREVDELYTVADEMRDVVQGRVNNNFSVRYRSILESKGPITQLDSAIVYFVHHPVNEQGFCSIPFTPLSGGKKKVLLLGDSFTWGRTVSNITNAFANELLARGYTVYNTGISGADPPQYLALAKKYITLLKPDIVIVNFAMGSDIENFPRQLQAFQPIFYRTNAGYLFACPLGVSLGGPVETYRFILIESTIPRTTGFNKCCSLSALGTMVWKFMYSLGIVSNTHPDHQAYWQKVNAITSETPFSNTELDGIRKLAGDNGARCIISAIPDLRPGGVSDPRSIPHLFEHIPYVYSPVQKEGYSLSDGHFNDLGHKQYSVFLDSLMRDQ